MICQKCGNECETAFCPKCGTKVEEKTICNNCGNTLKSGDLFCNKCGYKINQDIEKTLNYSLTNNNDSIIHLAISSIFILLLFFKGFFNYIVDVSIGSLDIYNNEINSGSFVFFLYGFNDIGGDFLQYFFVFVLLIMILINVVITIKNIKAKTNYKKISFKINLATIIYFSVIILLGLVLFADPDVGSGGFSGSREFGSFGVLFFIEYALLIFDSVLYKRNINNKFLIVKKGSVK